ncbi:MAG: hypothetical protein NTU44_00470 [Bacteroidetes bacterium]|nr:hypothetical protein [Bacteroidota bacterium]
MKRITSFILLAFIILSGFASFCQEQTIVLSKEPVDSVKNLKAIALIDKVMKKDNNDPNFNRISVLGNPDCGHCVELEKIMKEQKIDFDLYDLRDNKLLIKIQTLISSRMPDTDRLAFNYPIVIFKGEVTHSIPDLNAFVEQLKKKMGN